MISPASLISADKTNKSEYINTRTTAYIDELSKKVTGVFGRKLSTFLFKYVPFLAKTVICVLECAAKNSYKAELQQNRCAQLDPKQNRYADLDPSQARNVSEEI